MWRKTAFNESSSTKEINKIGELTKSQQFCRDTDKFFEIVENKNSTSSDLIDVFFAFKKYDCRNDINGFYRSCSARELSNIRDFTDQFFSCFVQHPNIDEDILGLVIDSEYLNHCAETVFKSPFLFDEDKEFVKAIANKNKL